MSGKTALYSCKNSIIEDLIKQHIITLEADRGHKIDPLINLDDDLQKDWGFDSLNLIGLETAIKIRLGLDFCKNNAEEFFIDCRQTRTIRQLISCFN